MNRPETDHPVEALSAYLDGELDSAEAASVEAHLRQCEECARLLDGLRLLSHAASAEEPPPVPAGLAGRIVRRLEPEPVRRPGFGLAWLQSFGAPLAAAAAGLLAAGILWIVWQSGPAPLSPAPLEREEPVSAQPSLPLPPPATPSSEPPIPQDVAAGDAEEPLRAADAVATKRSGRGDTGPVVPPAGETPGRGGEGRIVKDADRATKGPAGELATRLTERETEMIEGLGYADSQTGTVVVEKDELAPVGRKLEVAPDKTAPARKEIDRVEAEQMRAADVIGGKLDEAKAAPRGARRASSPVESQMASSGRETPGTELAVLAPESVASAAEATYAESSQDLVAREADYEIRLSPSGDLSVHSGEYACSVTIRELSETASRQPPVDDRFNGSDRPAQADLSADLRGKLQSMEEAEAGQRYLSEAEAAAEVKPEARQRALHDLLVRLVRERYRQRLEQECGPLPPAIAEPPDLERP
jgi:hypothetical protein